MFTFLRFPNISIVNFQAHKNCVLEMCAREQKLKRLLHYGREIPFYQPGDKLTDEECLSTLSSKIILDTEIFTDAANSIVKAFSDGYSAHPCMLVFALAVCAKQKKSSELREAAYKAAKTVCSSAEHLLLFVKLANKIAATSENDSCKYISEILLKRLCLVSKNSFYINVCDTCRLGQWLKKSL